MESDEVVARAAELAGENPAKVLVEMRSERAAGDTAAPPPSPPVDLPPE